jgi:hypothetical protein
MKSPLLTVLTVVGVLGTASVAMAANTDTLTGIFDASDPVSASEGLATQSDSATSALLVPDPAVPAPGAPPTQTNQPTGRVSEPATSPVVNPAPAPSPSDGTTGGSGGDDDDEYEDDEDEDEDDDDDEDEDDDDD